MTPHEATQNALTVREASLLYSVPSSDLRAALVACELPYQSDADGTIYVDADDVSRWTETR